MIDRQLEGGPAVTLEELMAIVPGPDFPTGAMMLGQGGARNAYATGRGSIMMRATHIRSEEHTSELQSLMRISYAVFCLKKKKHHTPCLPTPRLTLLPYTHITPTPHPPPHNANTTPPPTFTPTS